jgi:hypothetical protein
MPYSHSAFTTIYKITYLLSILDQYNTTLDKITWRFSLKLQSSKSRRDDIWVEDYLEMTLSPVGTEYNYHTGNVYFVPTALWC